VTYGFHPEAEAEHYETVAFYESRQPGLGAGYLSEFEEVMGRVVELPQAFRIERKPNIRRAHLTRFPYTVIYREVEGAVQVLAVAHKRRRPSYWTGRL
jgi:plasmid stabilization system protein ParE